MKSARATLMIFFLTSGCGGGADSSVRVMSVHDLAVHDLAVHDLAVHDLAVHDLAVHDMARSKHEVTVAPAIKGADPTAASCKRTGMTWAWISRAIDVDSVGSDGATNPYAGDTSCNTSLPILCIRRIGAAQPSYVTTNYYYGWTGSYVAMTRAHVGNDMSSGADADAICAGELGAGWRMAEFHDGNGGWHFQTYGAAAQIGRFWVAINDQRANCWNTACR